MGRANILEGGDIEEFERGGKKKIRGFRRVSIDEKYSSIRQLEQDKGELKELKVRKSLQAQSLHVESQIHKGENPENIDKGESIESGNSPVEKNPDLLSVSAKNIDENPYSPINDLAHWEDDDNEMLGAVAEVLDQSRDAELKEIKTHIDKEFSDSEEQGAIESLIDGYPKYFIDKKDKAERKKIKIDENWIEAIRQYYIDEGKRRGLMKQLAPEKADLLGKYLELRLPGGIVEKDPGKGFAKREQKEKDLLNHEQRNFITRVMIFLKRLSEGALEIAVKKERREFGSGELQILMGSILEDLKQKYLISQPGYMEVFDETDVQKIVNMVIEKRQRNNK